MSHNNFIVFVKKIILNHLNENINSDFIAKKMGISRMQLHRRLKLITGMNTRDFITNIRIEAAKKLLQNTDKKIKCIAKEVGYPNTSYFAKVFRKNTNCLPYDFRKENSIFFQ